MKKIEDWAAGKTGSAETGRRRVDENLLLIPGLLAIISEKPQWLPLFC